jgi:hypothetical protein
MGSKITGILLFIVAAGIFVYIGRSGTLSHVTFPALTLPHLSTSTPGSVVTLPQSSGQYISNPPSSQTTPATTTQPAINPRDIPEGFSANQLSPWFHKVYLRVTPGENGYIILSPYLANASDSVNVSGWLVQSKRTKSGKYIPRAVRVYDSGGSAPEGPIMLKNGQVVYVNFSGFSPLGVNFLTNECLGYLVAEQPSLNLPGGCPVPTLAELDKAGIGGYCQNYILSVGSCRLPSFDDPKIQNDDACLVYLRTMNYRGCVQKYRSDPYFFGYEWRTWSAGSFLDLYHDHVLLFDSQGLLVDVYDY